MLEWFLNPGYLAAAAALISVPIIIHLINRMRLKRIRWAAMEFLLKAQKCNRRRLIIEQLLLLALRCLLVALVGFLVLRFVGVNIFDFGTKHVLHVVLIDDTLSMNDTFKDPDGKLRTSFDVAKHDVFRGKIVKALEKANANDQIMVLPLTKALDPAYEPKIFSKLNTHAMLAFMGIELEGVVTPTQCAASLHEAVARVGRLLEKEENARVTLHVISDFRQRDWGQSEAKALHQTFKRLADKSREFKAKLIDVAHPFWSKGQSDPLSHDNVGIVDFRAGTRVAGKSMPVAFTATIANFSGREAEVRVAVYDKTGAERQEINFSPLMPMKISPFSAATVTFEMRFDPSIKANEAYFEEIAIRLKSPTLGELENDGLAADNVRFAAVEIREKVPILVIDGEGARGRTDTDKDSFFVNTALMSTAGASFEVFWGDELAGGIAAKALERADLGKFPSIFLLNVRDLTPKQLANLEAYVRDGGGVCIFMGPQVAPKFYNDKLYNGGAGLFPVPLADTYYPAPNDDPRKAEFTGQPQVLLREELFDEGAQFPIFGDIFKKDSKQREVLKDLPVHRYFKVPRSRWKVEPGRIVEIATLPNEAPITDYQKATVDLIRGRLSKAFGYGDKSPPEGLERHRRAIETLVAPGSDKPAYALAPAIDALLSDKGDPTKAKDYPNLVEAWSSADPKVAALKSDLIKLRDEVRFGDPFVVAGNFGKGRVVAVMSTAGKEWNDWAGGSTATLVYQPFIQETQAYLSSQSSEDNRMVGTTDHVVLDAEAYRGKQLKARRVFYQATADKPSKAIDQGETFSTEVQGQLVFSFPKNDEPGIYLTTVRDDSRAIMTQGRAFNVDTAREGPLERVRRGEIESNVIGDFKDRISFEGPMVNDDSLVNRVSDSSESPWLYLLFLFVLVVEQALAVHLSFHLKGNENEVLTRIAHRELTGS